MRKDSQDKNKHNQFLTNQLKARLFDKGIHFAILGFSYGTLPSVKR